MRLSRATFIGPRQRIIGRAGTRKPEGAVSSASRLASAGTDRTGTGLGGAEASSEQVALTAYAYIAGAFTPER
jgi:hypothetical protein